MIYTVYPYRDFNRTLIEYWNFTHANDRIAYAASPASWGVDADAHPQDTDISSDVYECIKKSDGLIILNDKHGTYLHDNIIDVIRYAVVCKVQVECYFELFENEIQQMRAIAGNLFHSHISTKRELRLKEFVFFEQKSIVVAFGNIVRGLNSSFTVCGVAKELESLGYKVVIISDDINLNILHSHYGLPVLEGDNEKRVLILNNYLHEIEMAAEPDVILFEFSDGMVKYSDEIYCGFGIDPFIESLALNVDYFVLNVTCSFVSNDEELHLDALKQLFSSRFNCDIDFLTVSNCFVSEENTESPEFPAMEKCNMTAVSNAIENNKSKYDMSVSLQLGSDTNNMIVQDCIDKLSRNIELI